MTQEWISVKDRLPQNYESRQMYIISNSGFVTFGFYYSNKKTWSDGKYDITSQVTHWMPLPQPPKGQP